MRTVFYSICALILTLSCSKKKDHESTIETKIKADTVLKTESETESDCVFDDDYKKITKEWLNEIGFKKYVWDEQNKQAILKYNNDTLIVRKGGCNHFVNSVQIRTNILPNKILDSILIKKITEIACKFKFENYCQKLTEGKYKEIIESNSSLFLEFEDEDPDDNLISEGIQISTDNKKTVIEISEYYN